MPPFASDVSHLPPSSPFRFSLSDHLCKTDPQPSIFHSPRGKALVHRTSWKNRFLGDNPPTAQHGRGCRHYVALCEAGGGTVRTAVIMLPIRPGGINRYRYWNGSPAPGDTVETFARHCRTITRLEGSCYRRNPPSRWLGLCAPRRTNARNWLSVIPHPPPNTVTTLWLRPCYTTFRLFIRPSSRTLSPHTRRIRHPCSPQRPSVSSTVVSTRPSVPT